MIDLFKKHYIVLINIFLGLTILPLLFSISFVNLEDIFQLNFSNIYVIIYFLYFLVGILGVLFLNKLKISDNTLKEELSYTFRSILLLSIFLVPSFFINHYFILEHISESNLYLRSYGKIAFMFFAFALTISPILKFVKSSITRETLILSRKLFGILSFVFFLKHGFEYFAIEYIFQASYHPDVSYFQYVYENMLVRMDALTGFVAGIMMLLLGITSNKFSIKVLSGKWWKTIQTLVYPGFLISVIHVAFASRFDNFYIFLFLLVIFTRTLAYFSKEKKSNIQSKKSTKYICIPCGYIYDETVGDPDSGIEPGTRFEDIPDDWVCPVCGVSKADFEAYEDGNQTIFGGYLGQVVNYKMLTSDVLELSLKVENNLSVKKGQYAILTLRDFDSEFNRAFSIVDYSDNTITFGIKVKDTGRGGRALKNLKIGDSVKIKGIYGDFVLQDTTNQKVFIATGTGLSPIVNMVNSQLKSENNYLFFGVQTKGDLFYIDKITNIKNVVTNIYLSREEIENYNYGRIDLSKFEFDNNAEFYICGNPLLVNATREYLEQKGFKNVYFEKFN